MKIRFPIRYKFLSVTTLLLVFSVVSYLFLASHIFRRDKIELVFDLNRSAVSSLASDVGTLFRGIADKMKLAAVLSQGGDSRSRSLLTDVLENDSNIVFLVASYDFQKFDHVFFADKEYEQTYAVSDEYFKNELIEQRPVPFNEIQTAGAAVWNATLKSGPPMIGFGKSVVPESGKGASGRAPYAIVAFIRADKLLQSFAGSRLNEVIAVNKFGQVLVHPANEAMQSAASFADHPLFKTAINQAVKTGVMSFDYQGQELLGAHSLTGDGEIYLLSQVDGRQAFSAVENLVRRSLIFASIAITLAFLAAVFFSRSLTRPIQALSEAMGKVAQGGELQAAAINVGTRDEISHLASSFNNMLEDLQVSRLKLEEINRDLEQKVKDRTRKLEEQNHAVKKAQEALLQSTRLATVGEVAGRAAHEVLNPLTSMVARVERVRNRLQRDAVQEVELIRDIVTGWESDMSRGGFNQLIESWKAPSQVDDSISLWQEDLGNVKRTEGILREEIKNLVADMDFILKESHRINKIVQNMRSLTRTRGDEKVIAVRDVLSQAVRIMADLGEQSGITFKENYVEGDDLVRLDPDEFIQCATNLIRNSIQAILSRRAQSGDPQIGEITISTSLSGPNVAIDLFDNGIGIKKEDKSKLFEIQFSTKPAAEGTGLGLTITRRFIRSFGGDIELVNSAPNEGCQFRILLPVDETSETQRVAV